MKAVIPLGLLLLASSLVVSCENNSDVDGGDTTPVAQSFRIEPSTTTVYTNTVTVLLTVFGGDPPFSWEVGDPTLGSLTGTNTETRTVNYRPEATATDGANTLRVTDSRAWSASTIIIHNTDN